MSLFWVIILLLLLLNVISRSLPTYHPHMTPMLECCLHKSPGVPREPRCRASWSWRYQKWTIFINLAAAVAVRQASLSQPARLLIILIRVWRLLYTGSTIAPEFLGANFGISAPWSATVWTRIVTSLVLPRNIHIKTTEMTWCLLPLSRPSDMRYLRSDCATLNQ